MQKLSEPITMESLEAISGLSTTSIDQFLENTNAPSMSKKSKKRSTFKTLGTTSKGKKVRVQEPLEETSESEDDYFENDDGLSAILNEGTLIAEKQKKENTSIAKLMLKDMMKNRITCYNDWIKHPDMYAEYCPVRGFENNCAKFYKLVAAQMTNFTFDQYHVPRLIASNQTSKIATLFKKQFTKKPWSDDGNVFMANLLRMHFNRQLGKRNTICFLGKSNAGKSQLASSYVEYMVGNHYGKPVNNIRSSFPFDGCVNKRMILWEEPMIHEDNIEDVKLLMEGNSLRADVKYASGGIDIRDTPVLITTNKPLYSHNPTFKDQLDNRSFQFYFGNVLTDKDVNFPLTNDDWAIFFSMYLRPSYTLNNVYTFLKSKPF